MLNRAKWLGINDVRKEWLFTSMNVRIRYGGIIIFIIIIALLTYKLLYTLLWAKPDDNGLLAGFVRKKPTAPTYTLPIDPSKLPPLTEWLVLAPIPRTSAKESNSFSPEASNTEKTHDIEQMLDTAYLTNESSLNPKAGEVVTVQKIARKWVAVKNAKVDLESIANKNMGYASHGSWDDYSIAYVVTTVTVPKSVTNATLYVESDDGVKVWLNKKEILKSTHITHLFLDANEITGLSLNSGVNTFVFKVVNFNGYWELAAALDMSKAKEK